MKRFDWSELHRALVPGLIAAGLLIGGALLFRPVSSGSSAPLPAVINPAVPKQGGLPVNGWTVCGDLGLGPVPGVPGTLQRVALCSGSGWVVHAYCIEPLKPVPALGTVCSMVNATDFWCGDPFQLIREYQIQQTPAPSSTAVPSPTPFPTATPLPTNTPVPTDTPVATITLTITQPGVTPSGGNQNTPTPAVQATVFTRPHAGGIGILAPTLFILAAITGLGLMAAAFMLNRRR